MHRNFKFLAFSNFYFFDVQASKRPTSSFPHPRFADSFFMDFYSFCITTDKGILQNITNGFPSQFTVVLRELCVLLSYFYVAHVKLALPGW